jgi:hypothetical protein
VPTPNSDQQPAAPPLAAPSSAVTAPRPASPPRASGGSSVAPALFWQQLLASLAQRRVIPVVGPDAVIIEGDLGPRPFVEYVARRLEDMLELGASPETDHVSLHDVACRFVAERGGQLDEDFYGTVKLATEGLAAEPPPALRKLARISAFNLYVTTTFDGLLEQAIDDERFQGQHRTLVRSYAPQKVEDLPSSVAELSCPLVYHLLGRMSPFPEYAVTEEDTLEFIHTLQSENHRPNLLLDGLCSNSLLIIGNGYSDWLARFFLRIAKRERLLVARSKTDIVADSRARDDASLSHFLRHFNTQTKIFAGGAIEFINELSDRWSAQQATSTPTPVVAVATNRADPVFISYASEDVAMAQALADAIKSAGLPVWFDRRGGLEGGDDYDAKIQDRIEHASFFVPILSPNVLTSERRYFRKEWRIAADVAMRAAPNLPFLVPVRTGQVPPDAPEVPEAIRRAHWMDLRPDSMDEIVQRLRALYREYQLSRQPA